MQIHTDDKKTSEGNMKCKKKMKSVEKYVKGYCLIFKVM